MPLQSSCQEIACARKTQVDEKCTFIVYPLLKPCTGEAEAIYTLREASAYLLPIRENEIVLARAETHCDAIVALPCANRADGVRRCSHVHGGIYRISCAKKADKRLRACRRKLEQPIMCIHMEFQIYDMLCVPVSRVCVYVVAVVPSRRQQGTKHIHTTCALRCDARCERHHDVKSHKTVFPFRRAQATASRER